MTADLVQRLRTSSGKERRAVAMELAQTGTNNAVAELIQMADGVKSYHPRAWRNLWFKKPAEFYGLDDQLIAIDALAETGSRRALKYLNRLADYNPDSYVYAVQQYSDGTTVGYSVARKIEFPFAKGELRRAINYKGGITVDGSGDPPDKHSWVTDVLAGNQTYKNIKLSIQKLETSLQNAPPTQ